MKAIFIIEEMHCSNCAIALESIEDELPGIKKIVASYQKQNLTVQFEPELINVKGIIQKINDKGYSVRTYKVEN
jgi:copper chaperone CopZ